MTIAGDSLPRYDVAMLGSRRHYVVPRALASVDMLETFYTDVYLGNKPAVQSVLNFIPPPLLPAALRRLQGRFHPDLPQGRVVSFDLMGAREVFHRQRVSEFSDLLQHFVRVGQRFCEQVIASGTMRGSGLYALTGAALELCREARTRGVPAVLDQNVAPFRFYNRLAREESERWPGWQPDLSEIPERDPFTEREEAEWQAADVIVTPSPFVSRELVNAGVEPARIQSLPFCVNRQFTPVPRDATEHETLNVLVIGDVSLMKGVQYLLQALQHLNSPRVSCRIVGALKVNPQCITPYRGRATFNGHVPFGEISRFYAWADVLVFPTLSDSFGMVQLEAMGHGVPVIATPNSGAVVRDGVDGFIVPIRDPFAIAARLDQLLSCPDLRRSLRQAAVERTRDFSFEGFRERLVALLAGAAQSKAEVQV